MNEAAILRAFGAKVRSQRELVGLSQEQLAHEIDLHRTYVGGIERGERNVSLLNIVRIARGLGVAPPELLRSLEKGE